MRPVPEYNAKSWLLKALRETAHAMESLIWDVDEDELTVRPESDEWSCVELIAHMCDMERHYIDRLERMARLDEPAIEAFGGESYEPSQDVGANRVFDLMDELGVLRQQTVYLLWSLDDCDWDRRGIHPYLGPLTVTQVAREMNEHDLAHLWQLRKLCDRVEAASV